MQTFIKTLTGETFTIETDYDDTVDILKQKISRRTGRRPGGMRLIWSGKLLTDGNLRAAASEGHIILVYRVEETQDTQSDLILQRIIDLIRESETINREAERLEQRAMEANREAELCRDRLLASVRGMNISAEEQRAKYQRRIASAAEMQRMRTEEYGEPDGGFNF